MLCLFQNHRFAHDLLTAANAAAAAAAAAAVFHGLFLTPKLP